MKDDSIEGIYDTLKHCALISKSAGGIGVAVSCIRATGSYIAGVSLQRNCASVSLFVTSPVLLFLWLLLLSWPLFEADPVKTRGSCFHVGLGTHPCKSNRGVVP